jgi:large subunit ribosomal protein L27
MAHKKGQGSIKNGRDSNAQRRGVKMFGGQRIRAGNIIVRQVGSSFWAGDGVGRGRDFTLFATRDGVIRFHKGGSKAHRRSYVSVDPVVVEDLEAAAE